VVVVAVAPALPARQAAQADWVVAPMDWQLEEGYPLLDYQILVVVELVVVLVVVGMAAVEWC